MTVCLDVFMHVCMLMYSCMYVYDMYLATHGGHY